LAGLVTLAFWQAARSHGLAAGGALGLALLIRAPMALYVLPLAWLVWRGAAQERRHLLAFGVPILLGVGGLLLHNALRSGNPWTSGYADQGFETPPWVGISGLLLAPGRSVFLFAPPLVLAVWLWRPFWRRWPALAEAIGLAWGLALLVYGSWWAWHGGWAWGPRFLVPLLPVSLLPLGLVWEQPRMLWRVGLAGAVLVGALVNGLGTWTDVNRTYSRYAEQRVHWNWSTSQIPGALEALQAGKAVPLRMERLGRIGWTESGKLAWPGILLGGLLSSLVGIIRKAAISHGREQTFFLRRPGRHRRRDDARGA
ncbi:MAG: hypothetical protein HC915_02850, partial [Anaerolineae bacterium]|nr:hypothetical protein [Anaerolineae bacterium]